jgi:hypothetical protein
MNAKHSEKPRPARREALRTVARGLLAAGGALYLTRLAYARGWCSTVGACASCPDASACPSAGILPQNGTDGR